MGDGVKSNQAVSWKKNESMTEKNWSVFDLSPEKCMYPTIIPLPVCLIGTVLVVESHSMRTSISQRNYSNEQ